MNLKNDQVKDLLNSKFDKKQNFLLALPGKIGDNNNNIYVEGQTNYIYVRISERVAKVFNNRVIPSLDVNVWVGYDSLQPDLQQVLGERADDPLYKEDDTDTFRVLPHHSTHEFPNPDTVYVQGRQFMPFRVTAAGGMNISVYRNIAWLGGQFREVAPTELIDLSSYGIAADLATRAKILLIEADPTGVINIVEGTEVDYDDLGFDDIPLPSAGAYDIALIRIYSGQTEIIETQAQTDITDPRFAYGSARPHMTVGFIDFDTAATYSDFAGRMGWNADEYTVNIVTGLGPVLQVGQELYTIVYNGTGTQIDNATAVYPVGAVAGRPSVAEADSATHVTINGIILVTTMDIPDGEIGITATILGKVRGIDTSGFNLGDTVWIAPGATGILNNITNIKPIFPNYPMQIGGITVSDAVDGEIQLAIDGKPIDTIQNFWNGTFRESIDFTVSSNGTVVTGSLSPDNGHEDMTMMFSDGFTILDTTPPKTITLTPGTDSNPQTNYVYILQSAKVLAVSTSDWPAAEHIKVANIILRSALTTQLDGALGNRNWNDHIESTTTLQGHLSHITEKLRQFEAQWHSGVEGSIDIVSASSPDDVYVKNTAGKAYQLHRQDFPILDMNQYVIDAVSIGSGTFTISDDGDLTSTFPDDRSIQINGSTGNDGMYTVASTLYSAPDFIITVEETIPDATVDGTIGDDIHVVNSSIAAYQSTLNLNTEVLDSTGATLSSRHFSFVVWAVQNRSGQASHLMLNLPSGSYNSSAAAIADTASYSNYNIPSIFQGTGFLIARFTFDLSPSGSGTWTLNNTEDLRGFLPNTTAGGGGGSGGGVTTFLGLTDTPSSYASQGLKLVRVNSGETAEEFAELGADIINAATAKTTPVDADEWALSDSAVSYVLKKITWANIKATLKTYFDTLYTGGSAGYTWLRKTANFTMSDNDGIIADATSGGFTLTLPLNPTSGEKVFIMDGGTGGSWEANNITVDRNGEQIDGSASNITLNENNGWVEIVFDAFTWRTRSHEFNQDGWMVSSDAWTYAGAQTFTISGDLTSLYKAGLKLKWTQTTVRYGIVESSSYSSPNTTVTIVTNTDYVIANAAITLNNISKISNPDDFPNRFAFTPVSTTWTIGNGTLQGYLTVRAGVIFGSIVFVLGSTSSIDSTIFIDLPTPIINTATTRKPLGITVHFDDSENDLYLGNTVYNDTQGKISPQRTVEGGASGNATQLSGTTATLPFTFTTDDSISIEFEYFMP